jgi:hypothetical protein
MVARAKDIGRTVPVDYMAEAYHAAPRVLDQMQKEFGDRIRVLGVDNSGAPGQQVVHADAERFLQNTADMPYGIQSSFGKRCRQPAESQRKHNAAAGDGDRRRSRSFATLWTTS